jgi:hypothetical protein
MKLTKLTISKSDGTIVDITYPPVPREEQERAISRWLLTEGRRRPAEAAMEVATTSVGKLRKFYRNLVMLDKVNPKGVTRTVRKVAP